MSRCTVRSSAYPVRNLRTASVPASCASSRNMVPVNMEKSVGDSLQPCFMPVVEVTCVSSPCALTPYRLPANRAATRSTISGSVHACSSVAIRSARSTMSKAWDRSRANQMPPSSWILPRPRFSSRLVRRCRLQAALTSVTCCTARPRASESPLWG